MGLDSTDPRAPVVWQAGLLGVIRARRVVRNWRLSPRTPLRLGTFTRLRRRGTDHDAIDQAYRSKYARYPTYVEPMVSPNATAATLRLAAR